MFQNIIEATELNVSRARTAKGSFIIKLSIFTVVPRYDRCIKANKNSL
jgi:hypothetical protein